MFAVKSNTCRVASPLRNLGRGGRSGQMIDSNLEEYLKEHEERIRRLDELYEKIKSPDYNDGEKKNFRQESLELCLGGLATV